MNKKLSFLFYGPYFPHRSRLEAEEAIKQRFIRLIDNAEQIKDDKERASLIDSIKAFMDLLPFLEGRELIEAPIPFIESCETSIQVSIHGVENANLSKHWDRVYAYYQREWEEETMRQAHEDVGGRT